MATSGESFVISALADDKVTPPSMLLQQDKLYRACKSSGPWATGKGCLIARRVDLICPPPNRVPRGRPVLPSGAFSRIAVRRIWTGGFGYAEIDLNPFVDWDIEAWDCD